jgi:hypothetical protein
MKCKQDCFQAEGRQFTGYSGGHSQRQFLMICLMILRKPLAALALMAALLFRHAA